MKWFKHLTGSGDDEKLSAVIDELGMEGYGFYWRLLEIVAEKLDASNDTSCQFSPKKWGNFFQFSAKKFMRFVNVLSSQSILNLEENDGLLKITFLQGIRVYSDEHATRMLDVSPSEWAYLRKLVFKRDNYTCQYCGKKSNRLECDHVVPFSKGGKSVIGNLLTSCRHCNRSKHAKMLKDWRGPYEY